MHINQYCQGGWLQRNYEIECVRELKRYDVYLLEQSTRYTHTRADKRYVTKIT